MERKEIDDDDERDKGWAWVVASACFISTFATLGFMRTKSVYYEAFKLTLDFTSEEATWPFTLMTALIQMSGVLFSHLIYYLTIRKLVIIGSILSALGSILCYISTDFVYILISLGVVNGIGTGLFSTFNPIIVSMYFNQYRTTAMGIATCGASMGSFTLAPLTYILIENYGIKGSFLILGGIILQCLPAACLYRQPKIAKDIQKVCNEESKIKNNGLRLTWEIVKDPLFLLIAFTFSVYNLFMYTLQTVMVDFAMMKGINKLTAVFFVSANSISDFIGRFSVGWLLDLGIIRKVTFVMICFFSLGGLTCALPHLWEYIGLMTIFCVLGVFFGCLRVEQYVLLSEYLDMNKLPVAVGLCNFIIGLVLFLQVPLIGYFEGIKRYDYMFYILATVLLLSAFLWMIEPLIKKCRKQNIQESSL